MLIPMIQALTDRNAVKYAELFGAPDVTTQEMRTAIWSWFEAYFASEEDADKKTDPCMRMAYTIIHKLDKGAFAEYHAVVLDKEKTAKGAWLDRCLSRLDRARHELLQWMLVGGEAYIKPVPETDPDGVTIFRPQVIRRDAVTILARAPDGRVTSIGSVERAAAGNRWYTLAETRSVDAAGWLTLTNKLFMSNTQDVLGRQVPLTALEQYAALPDRYTYARPVGSLGLAVLRTPIVNCVDGSADAVSIYAPAMGLIRNIDRNEKLLNQEFELGRHRIIAPSEMLRTDKKGERHFEDSIFESCGTAYTETQRNAGLTVFSPALRDEAYERRQQAYLRAIENQIGMKRGMLSDAQEVERTAFEVASTAGDYNLSLIDLQRAWFDGVRDYLQLCDRLGQLYKYCDDSVWDVHEQLSITWGNGVLYDPDKQWQEDCEMVRLGYLKAEIALARKYDMPWETEADLAAVRAKYMPSANDLTETERLR